jgi:hypothetical protein
MGECQFGGGVLPVRLADVETVVKTVIGQAGRVRHPLHRVDDDARVLGWPLGIVGTVAGITAVTAKRCRRDPLMSGSCTGGYTSRC